MGRGERGVLECVDLGLDQNAVAPPPGPPGPPGPPALPNTSPSHLCVEKISNVEGRVFFRSGVKKLSPAKAEHDSEKQGMKKEKRYPMHRRGFNVGTYARQRWEKGA